MVRCSFKILKIGFDSHVYPYYDKSIVLARNSWRLLQNGTVGTYLSGGHSRRHGFTKVRVVRA